MKDGEKYYTFYKNGSTGYTQVLQATWKGDFIDLRRQEEGRVYDSLEKAKTSAGIREGRSSHNYSRGHDEY